MEGRVREHVLAIDKEVEDLGKQVLKLADTIEACDTKIKDDEKVLDQARALCSMRHDELQEAWKAHNKIKTRQATAVSELHPTQLHGTNYFKSKRRSSIRWRT
jgi:predicted  nucleic acid-binding Zn-ribbon protein